MQQQGVLEDEYLPEGWKHIHNEVGYRDTNNNYWNELPDNIKLEQACRKIDNLQKQIDKLNATKSNVDAPYFLHINHKWRAGTLQILVGFQAKQQMTEYLKSIKLCHTAVNDTEFGVSFVMKDAPMDVTNILNKDYIIDSGTYVGELWYLWCQKK
jgi:hypothetical protein